MSEDSRRLLVIGGTGTLLVLMVLLLRMDWPDRDRIRAAQSFHHPRIDPERDVGTVLATHPGLGDVEWSSGWGGDERLVCAKLRIDTLDRLPVALLGDFRRLVALTPEWTGIAGDRPADLRIVFRVEKSAVELATVRLSEAWVIYHPEVVADYERALEQSLERAGSTSTTRRYRLVHDGERALFDAGVLDPILAGAGEAMDGLDWLGAVAAWGRTIQDHDNATGSQHPVAGHDQR